MQEHEMDMTVVFDDDERYTELDAYVLKDKIISIVSACDPIEDSSFLTDIYLNNFNN